MPECSGRSSANPNAAYADRHGGGLVDVDISLPEIVSRRYWDNLEEETRSGLTDLLLVGATGNISRHRLEALAASNDQAHDRGTDDGSTPRFG